MFGFYYISKISFLHQQKIIEGIYSRKVSREKLSHWPTIFFFLAVIFVKLCLFVNNIVNILTCIITSDKLYYCIYLYTIAHLPTIHICLLSFLAIIILIFFSCFQISQWKLLETTWCEATSWLCWSLPWPVSHLLQNVVQDSFIYSFRFY